MSLQAFLAVWKKTSVVEKGYVSNKYDSGLATNHGISQNVARANGYFGDMYDLPSERAANIAKTQYWDILRLDDVAEVSLAIASELFDTGFLCGIGNSGFFLQRALNCFNRSHKTVGPDYPEVVEDRIIGPATVYALRLYLGKRGSNGELVLLRCLNSQQGTYLMELSRSREKDEEFTFGWFLNRVVI